MKNVLKAFGIIAFVAVIGFSMAACGGDDDSGGGGGGSYYLGETPTLSGKVYVEKWNDDDTFSYQAYTGGNLTVIAMNVTHGTIKNGQLSITLGTPVYLDDLENVHPYDSLLDNKITISPSNAKGCELSLYYTDDPDGFLDPYYKDYELLRGNTTVSGTSYTSEYVRYLYVDRDSTISSNGANYTFGNNNSDGTIDSNGDNTTYTYKPFSLALKTGWNTICYKYQSSVSGKTRTLTITHSMGNPSNLKWVLSSEGGDSDHNGPEAADQM